MRNRPPQDDERDEHPPITYPRQRRREAARAQPPSENQYHSDAYPYTPKIRRASRQVSEEATRPLSETEREAGERTVDKENKARPRPPQRPTGNASATAPRRPRYRPPAAAQHTQRTQHIQHAPAPQQPQLTFLTRLHALSCGRNAMIIASVALVAIIVISLALNANHAGQGSIFHFPGNPASSGQPGSGPLPADPHEIVITPADTEHPAPPVFATSAYLLDADTGATLYAYNPFMHLPMLSTTKLMTAVLAVEHGNPDQLITINGAISHDISQLAADSSLFGIKPGETYTLRDLLYGLLLPSGNDAAVAIADTIGGDLDHFVAEMNQSARQLGMYDTHYMNPHGLLDTGHYSSAHDLAILGRYSLSLPLIRQISGTKIYHIPAGGNHPERFAVNGNQFLWWYPGADGGKPGWDGANNFVQVVSSVRNHHHLIGVTMHTKDWWTDMRDLMNWGFNSFTWISPYDVDFQHPIPYDNQWNYFVKDKKTNTIPTADGGRYYIYTGYSISGPILTYFDQVGGLPKFGYPTGMPVVINTPTITQKFEQATIQCDLTSKQCKTT